MAVIKYAGFIGQVISGAQLMVKQRNCTYGA